VYVNSAFALFLLLSLCLSLFSLALPFSLSLSVSGPLSVSLTVPSLFSLSLCALFFACAALSVSRRPSCLALRPVSLSFSLSHTRHVQVNAPNCECTQNLTCMPRQSSKRLKPSPITSPEGSANGKRREVSTYFSSPDGKRITAGVVPSLGLSPSLTRSMSLMAISQVCLSLSLSVLLSLSLFCSFSFSLSLSLIHTSSVPFSLSLCVFLALCASSLALYPDAGKLRSLLQSKVFTSRLISRARSLCSLFLSLSALCVSLNLSLSLSLFLSLSSLGSSINFRAQQK